MFTRSAVFVGLVGYAAAFASAPMLAKRASSSRMALRAKAPSMKVGVFYGTSTGNTQSVAERIAAALGGEVHDIDSVQASKMLEYDSLVIGAPTWNTDADKQRSSTAWDEIIYDDVPSMDFTGKKVAFFGCGDSQSYGDNWCDAIGELHEKFSATGISVIGMVPKANFDGEYFESKAIQGDNFLGHPFCEDHMPHKTDERIPTWVAQLQSEGCA